MDIFLVRHGESKANLQGIYQGHTYDTSLTNKGIEQARAVAYYLADKYPQIGAVYASPLKRTYQTAEQIAAVLFVPEIKTDQALLEINHGLWEGNSLEQIAQLYPHEWQLWHQQPDQVKMPQGETLEQVQTRAVEFLQNLSHTGEQQVVVVSHDAWIRTVLCHVLQRPLSDFWSFDLHNAGLTVLDWDELPKVVTISEDSYLSQLQSDLSLQAR